MTIKSWTAERPALVSTFRVGSRIVTMTLPAFRPGEVSHITTEWEPDLPRWLSKREWNQYRAGRDAAVAELARGAGVKAAILEL